MKTLMGIKIGNLKAANEYLEANYRCLQRMMVDAYYEEENESKYTERIIQQIKITYKAIEHVERKKKALHKERYGNTSNSKTSKQT